jgi:LysR family transcriptional regulator, nod-box dependent transcriptional activator
MRFNKLDLNLLAALDVLLAERNIGRAAKRLNMSQSAMSGCLARLREYFGDKLLVAAGRRLVVTPRGESLAEPVREALLKVRSVITTQPQFDPATARRRFSIAASDYMLTVLLAKVIARMQQTAPGIGFDLVPVSVAALERLDHGELDLLILPEMMTLASRPKEVLFEDTTVCVVWKHNRRVGDAISLEQYLALGHVVPRLIEYRPASPAREYIAGLRRSINSEVTATYFGALPQLVVGTDRVANMLRRHAEIWARLLPLKLLALPFKVPPVREAMQWHPVVDDDPGHLWLRGELKAAAAALPSLDSRIHGKRVRSRRAK